MIWIGETRRWFGQVFCAVMVTTPSVAGPNSDLINAKPTVPGDVMKFLASLSSYVVKHADHEQTQLVVPTNLSNGGWLYINSVGYRVIHVESTMFVESKKQLASYNCHLVGCTLLWPSSGA